jgi:enoyl-CoA hydratase
MTSGSIVLDSPMAGVLRVTLNRPRHLNALTAELVEELYKVLDRVALDQKCRVLVLTGSGKGFCSGLDLNGYGELDEGLGRGEIQRAFSVQQHIAGLVTRLRKLPQPVIAAVNGAASGGGFALVLGSDIRIAADTAKFNAAFVRIGLSGCDIGTSWLLPRLVGAGRAHELMLTGRLFPADEAKQMGLLVDVVPGEDLEDRVLEEAVSVMQNSPMGVRMTKEVMWSAMEIPGLQAAIDLENRTQVMLLQTLDHREALESFIENRRPDFQDS